MQDAQTIPDRTPGEQKLLGEGVSGSAARSQRKFSSCRTGGIPELAVKLLLVLEGEREREGDLRTLELAGGKQA